MDRKNIQLQWCSVRVSKVFSESLKILRGKLQPIWKNNNLAISLMIIQYVCRGSMTNFILNWNLVTMQWIPWEGFPSINCSALLINSSLMSQKNGKIPWKICNVQPHSWFRLVSLWGLWKQLWKVRAFGVIELLSKTRYTRLVDCWKEIYKFEYLFNKQFLIRILYYSIGSTAILTMAIDR